MKKPGKKNTIILLLSLIIAGAAIFILVRFATVDRSALKNSRDKTYAINVMLQRPENWHKITQISFLNYKDMAMIDGSTATIPITAEIARQFFDLSNEKISGAFRHNTTHDAYVNLIDKNVQSIDLSSQEQTVSLIFVTPPSDEETAYAKEKGVELDIKPVALDGFVFITHKDNPVDSLTVEQIKDIYSGKITNWKEVGGNDEKIVAYQREKNSGSQTAMENLVMQGEQLADCPKAMLVEGMGELIECVAEYKNNTCSIGYTYYYYMNNLYKNENIKMIKVNGVSPENENLVSGEYIFTTAYYAVMRADEPNDSNIRRLRDYMLSDEGQQLIELAGYCPLKG